MLAWMLVIAAGGGSPLTEARQCDRIEINHYHEIEEEHDGFRVVSAAVEYKFTQLVMWDECTEPGCKCDGERVQQWAMLKDWQVSSSGSHRRVMYHEGEWLRIVQAKHLTETWTLYDPERLDKRVHRSGERDRWAAQRSRQRIYER